MPKLVLLWSMSASLLLMPFFVYAISDVEQTYVTKIDYTLEQPFGGEDSIVSLTQYINLVYAFALGIVGIIAVVLIMFGGLRWIAAAGNESVITEAKEVISSAVIGLTIALLSYVLLVFINPALVTSPLSVPKVIPPGSDSIVDLPKCDSADFTGKTCTNVDTGVSANCETMTCGEQGTVDGLFCRGTVCSTSGTGCYRGPADPMAYSCQNTYCGQWAQECADSNYKKYSDAGTTFESQFHSCACNYYTKEVMSLFGVRAQTKADTYVIADADDTDEQEEIHEVLCTEQYTQERWVSAVETNGASSGYTLAPSSAALKGWNCGFTSCDINVGFMYSGGDTFDRCWVGT